MFYVVDKGNGFSPVKSGFKTASQANNWAKKNLPEDAIWFWGQKHDWSKNYRFFVRKK